jgi:hypothetical protein
VRYSGDYYRSWQNRRRGAQSDKPNSALCSHCSRAGGGVDGERGSSSTGRGFTTSTSDRKLIDGSAGQWAKAVKAVAR